MPRKQNGFGDFKPKAVNTNFSKGKGSKALGYYPSERRFGSTIQRSVIEQYNADSSWSSWRKGMEYYFQGAYLDFTDTNAVLYQGTNFEIPVSFDGYRFATRNADSRTHYCIRRTVDETSNKQLGFITEIQNDKNLYPEAYLRNEIYAKITAGRDIYSDDLLVRSQGERITDGETAANITWVLTSDKKPAVYMGKSPNEGTTVSITIPLDKVRESDFITVQNKGNLQALVGQTVYMPDFVVNRPITLFDQFTDFPQYFAVQVGDFVAGEQVTILPNDNTLPYLLNEISTVEPIFETTDTAGRLNGAFVFKKDSVQRFWGQQYLTADLVRDNVDSLAYAIQPWNIQSILVDEVSNEIQLTSTPFQASLKLFTPSESERYVIFASNSFTKENEDYDANGNYNHPAPVPGEQIWHKIDLDVDPWMDEVFTAGGALVFADLYTCSCPSYLRAIIRSPEVYDERNNKLNRQVRAPFPTSKGTNDFDLAGIGRAATIAQTWSTMDYRRGFKVCKHTIASMFINKLRVQEPNTLPSWEAREYFEEKMSKDINEVAEEFNAQLRRSEITTVEIIYALAEALNLDDVELGYVLLTSKF